MRTDLPAGANALPALACLALLLLPGCLGVPPGTVRPGDMVTVHFTATDPASGALLDEGDVTFVAGAGLSGLGPAVEAALAGHRANETVRLQARLAGIVEVEQAFQELARVQTYNTSGFARAVGPPTVGLAFRAFGGYNATLTAVTPALVTFELAPRDGERQPHPEVGLTVVFSSQGDRLLETLEPTPGTVFTIDPTRQLGLQPVGPGAPPRLPDGTYRVLPAADGHLRFAHTAAMQESMLDRDVAVTATIVSVQPGQAAPPQVPGGYGARSSPQLRGDPASVLGTGTAAPHH